MTEQRFNDEEVSLILRRAVEGGAADAAGLTLSQLKEIAAEVGMDPARVEAAALSVQAERMAGGAHRGGRGVTARYDLQVAGHVDEARRADILRAVRQVMGRHGVVAQDESMLEWKARDYFGGRYITVHSQDGRTHIEALGNFRDGAFVTASAGGAMGMFVAALVLKATGLTAAVVWPVGLLAGAVLPAWALYRRTFRREDAALRTAVAEIAARVQPGTDEPVTLDGSGPAPGLPPAEPSPGGGAPPRP